MKDKRKSRASIAEQATFFRQRRPLRRTSQLSLERSIESFKKLEFPFATTMAAYSQQVDLQQTDENTVVFHIQRFGRQKGKPVVMAQAAGKLLRDGDDTRIEGFSWINYGYYTFFTRPTVLIFLGVVLMMGAMIPPPTFQIFIVIMLLVGLWYIYFGITETRKDLLEDIRKAAENDLDTQPPAKLTETEQALDDLLNNMANAPDEKKKKKH